jgi:hypothetical protein
VEEAREELKSKGFTEEEINKLSDLGDGFQSLIAEYIAILFDARKRYKPDERLCCRIEAVMSAVDILFGGIKKAIFHGLIEAGSRGSVDKKDIEKPNVKEGMYG